MKDLMSGDVVDVRGYTSKPGKGLTYPDLYGVVLLDDAWASAGWDVVDVVDDDGTVFSVYCFSIIRGEQELDGTEID